MFCLFICHSQPPHSFTPAPIIFLTNPPSLPLFLPSLLSFSDSTPCSLHVYFWSLSSSPHASAALPQVLIIRLPLFLPLSRLVHPLSGRPSRPRASERLCTRAPSHTCARTHRCIFAHTDFVSFPRLCDYGRSDRAAF